MIGVGPMRRFPVDMFALIAPGEMEEMVLLREGVSLLSPVLG